MSLIHRNLYEVSLGSIRTVFLNRRFTSSTAVLYALWLLPIIYCIPLYATGNNTKAAETPKKEIIREKIAETVLKDVRIEITPDSGAKHWEGKHVEQALAELRAAWRQQHGSPNIAFLTCLKQDYQPTEINLTAEQTTVKEILDRLCKQTGLKLEIRNGMVALCSPSKQINIPDNPFQNMVDEDIANKMRSFSVPKILFNNARFDDIARYLNERSQQLEADYGVEFAVDKKVADRTVQLKLFDVPMYDLLRFLCGKTETRLVYIPERKKIVFAEPGTQISKISVVKRKSQTETIRPISGKRKDKERSPFEKSKFGIELGSFDWFYDKNDKVVFNDRPAHLSMYLQFHAGTFKGPNGQKIHIPSNHKSVCDDNARVLKKVEMAPFAHGTSFRIDIRPSDATKRGKERALEWEQLPINQATNWLTFVQQPAIEMNETSKIVAVYNNKQYNFGDKMIPEGHYSVSASVRLKLFFEEDADPVTTVATLTDQRKFTSSNKDDKVFYKAWTFFINWINTRAPQQSLDDLPGQQWQKRNALRALSEAKKGGIEFDPLYCAEIYQELDKYEEAYKVIKDSEYTDPDRIDQLGPHRQGFVLRLINRVSRKAGKPHPLQGSKYEPESDSAKRNK